MCPSEIGLILLIIIIGVAVSIMIKGQATSEVKEGFVNNQQQQQEFTNINFCPFNSTAVMTNSGETLCCQGQTSRRAGCLQKTVCSLSNTQGKSYGPCSKVYGEYIKQMSKFCPINLPKYFEKRDPSNKDVVVQKGCYEGATAIGKYEPVSSEQKKCIMYNSQRESDLNLDSCINQNSIIATTNRVKFDLKLPTVEVKLVKFNDQAPPLVQVSYMAKRPMLGGAIDMPSTTYTFASILRFWRYVWPDYYKFNWKDITATQLEFIYEVNASIILNRINIAQKNIFNLWAPYFQRFN